MTLGQARDITQLTVFGRNDCCSDRDIYGYQLFNGTTVVASGTLDPGGANNSATATFAAANAVPEPATWAMMIGGFGLIGAAARRRTRANVTFA